MTVWVDNARLPFRRMIMCHCWSDSRLELDLMMLDIKMQLRWYQPESFPHFDLSLTMRDRAIANGALPVNMRDGVFIRMAIREHMFKDPEYAAQWHSDPVVCKRLAARWGYERHMIEDKNDG